MSKMKALGMLFFIRSMLVIAQITNITKKSYGNCASIAFDYQWFACTTINSSNTLKFMKINSTNVTYNVSYYPFYMQGKINISSNIRKFLIVNSVNQLSIYEKSTTTHDTQLGNIKIALFLSDTYLASITTAFVLYRMNASNIIQMDKNFTGFKYNNSFIIGGDQTKFGVISSNASFNSTLTIFNINFTNLSQIQLSNGGGDIQIKYDPSRQYFLRCAKKIVQVFNSTLFSIVSFNTTSVPSCFFLSTAQFYSAEFCDNFLIVVIDNVIGVIQTQNWTYIQCFLISNLFTKLRIKCYVGYSMFGIAYNDTTSSTILQQFTINYTLINTINNSNSSNNTSTTNNTNNTINSNNTNNINNTNNTNNSTNLVNITITPININNSIVINQSVNNTNNSNVLAPQSPPIETINQQQRKQGDTIINNMISVFNSTQAKQITNPTFQAIGICLSSPLTMNFVRPFMSVLSDFWFYGFHSTKYTEFVELFTHQVDIWNELRIKPEIFNEVTITQNQLRNEIYVNTSFLHERANKSVYMFLSIQEIYIFNLPICLAQWLINIILKFLIDMFVTNQSGAFGKIHKRITIGTLWWSFLIALFEPNIAQVTFFGLIQMNSFFSVDFIARTNLVVTTLLIFVIFFYSFTIFLTIKILVKQKNTRHAYEISKNKSKFRGVVLQTSLRGLRSFSQALAHAVFINSNQMQLGGLVLLDIMFVGMLIRLHQCFKSRVNFILSLLYYLALLSFDMMLNVLIRSQTIKNRQTSADMYNYQFASMIIIFFIAGMIILKSLLEILRLIISGAKFLFTKKNKIKNKTNKSDSKDDNKEKFSYVLSQKQKKIITQKKIQKELEKEKQAQKSNMQIQNRKKFNLKAAQKHLKFKSKKTFSKHVGNVTLRIHVVHNKQDIVL